MSIGRLNVDWLTTSSSIPAVQRLDNTDISITVHSYQPIIIIIIIIIIINGYDLVRAVDSFVFSSYICGFALILSYRSRFFWFLQIERLSQIV